MTRGRAADQVLGADLVTPLAPNAAIGLGTFHVVPPTGGTAVALKAGAAAFPDIIAGPGKFLQLVVDITAITATGTVTVSIFGFDPVSQKFYLILGSAALGAVATTVLRVGPGLTAAVNTVANDFMPPEWAVQVVVATAAPMTFSLGALFMP